MRPDAAAPIRPTCYLNRAQRNCDRAAAMARSFIQRLLGLPRTPRLRDSGAMSVDPQTGRIEIDIGRAPELSDVGAAVRLTDPALTEPVVVVRMAMNRFFALVGCCGHVHRRIDPILGRSEFRCCGPLPGEAHTADGAHLHGAGLPCSDAAPPVRLVQVQIGENGELRIDLTPGNPTEVPGTPPRSGTGDAAN
jgi:hypothetical protein